MKSVTALKRYLILGGTYITILAASVQMLQAAQTKSGNELAASLIGRDIGVSNFFGSVGFTQGVFSVRGSGEDIWQGFDAFHFPNIFLDGDLQVTVRVLSLQNTHPWAKAGLMIRESLAPDSRYAFVLISPTNGVSFQYRPEPAKESTEGVPNEMRAFTSENLLSFIEKPVPPYWLRLTRSGQRFIAHCSTDGVTWEWIGTQDLGLPSGVYVGLAVSSHDRAKPTTAQFDNLTVSSHSVPTMAALLGTGDGLHAIYYQNADLSGKAVSRIDPGIDFDWNLSNPIQGIDRERFSVRWDGEVQAQFSEVYAFHLLSDDRAKLWLNGKLLIDDPSGHAPLEASGTVALEAGKRYHVRVEYFQNGQGAVAKLLWSSQSTPKQMIPVTQLYSAMTDIDGDKLPDAWERNFGLDPGNPIDSTSDGDNDGYSNLQEFSLGTDPAEPDRIPIEGGWIGQTVGNPAVRGGGRVEQGTFVVKGAGGDVWANADSFHFIYKLVSGDTQIVARVVGLQNTHPWAKAGLMIRENANDGARHVMLALTPENGVTFQSRNEPGGTCTDESGGLATAPCWLKLVRQGNTFIAYRSTEGGEWQWIATEQISMAEQVMIGLAVSSHSLTRSCDARFDNVTFGTVPTKGSQLVGTGTGLQAHYFDAVTSNLVTRIDPTISFNWGEGSPASGIGTNYFTARWDGLLEAQSSELHSFHLINDDGARLWLNGKVIIDAWSDRPAVRTSAKVFLKAGQKYLVKVEFYERTGQAVLNLQWSSPSKPRQPVPQTQFYPPGSEDYEKIGDKDGDGMPDRWEVQVGLDPTNASDADLDPDSDRLTNLQEFFAGTNPNAADTDGDGLPDGWEVSQNLNPLDSGDAVVDSDRDGLKNAQEYAFGTKPLDEDSDGDGLFDGLEALDSRTDPLSPDVTNIVTIAEVSGAEAIEKLGIWRVDGRSIFSESFRGGLEYLLSVPEACVYRLEIEGGSRRGADKISPLRLLLEIDGENLGASELKAVGEEVGVTHAYTPWIQPGVHRVKIFWDNALRGKSLRINAVRLQALQGADANGNGVQDWAEARLAGTSGVDVAPIESSTSPACFEGRGRYLSMMSISGQVSPQHGINNRWYANIPLNVAGETLVTFSFENGGLTRTNRILWKPTNLLEAEDPVIREGDSLLLVAQPAGGGDGTMEIQVDGVTNYQNSASQAIPHRFTKAGSFKVRGAWHGPDGSVQSRQITVRVLGIPGMESPAVWVGRSRVWDLPNLVDPVVLEADSRLNLQRTQLLTNNLTRFSLATDAAENRHVVLRVGTNGPVLASTSVRGFKLYTAADTYVQMVQRYDDGSQLIEMGLVMTPLQPQVTTRLEVNVGGVIFDDGTLIKALHISDYDSLGHAIVRFIRPASAQTSVCHTTKALQGEVFIGIHR